LATLLTRFGWLSAITAGLVAALMSRAAAHVVYAPTTLREWVKNADVIAVAEIVAPLRVWRAADGSDLQEYLSVHVVEMLRGTPPSEDFDYFPHAEGEPRYQPGDRALIFLEKTEPRRDRAAVASRFPYFSRQGAGNEWKLSGVDDPALEMTRAWAALPAAASPADTRALLLRQLLLDNARLRRDAVLELVRFARQPEAWPDAAAVEPFARLTTSSSLTAGERIALTRALDRTPGFDAAAALLPLTRVELDESARKSLFSAASLSRDPRLSAWLAAQLDSTDPVLRREAANALAHPWHAAHVAKLLEVALGDANEGVARSAVQALAAIDNAASRAGLGVVGERRGDSVAVTARRLLIERTPSQSSHPR
jgi:hypothetical protein